MGEIKVETINAILSHFQYFYYGWKYLLIYIFLLTSGFILYKIKFEKKESFFSKNFDLINLIVCNIIINLYEPIIYDIRSIFNLTTEGEIGLGLLILQFSIFVGPTYLILLKYIIKIIEKKINKINTKSHFNINA
ncbi:MAG: hypothetical protein ACK4YF_06550 [Exilispira sp.]